MTDVVEIKLAEWQASTPTPGSRLEGRTLAGPVERALATRLARARMLEVTELRAGLSVRSFSHVGTVRLGNLTVTIVPKLNQASLLNLLRYAYGFRKISLLPEAAQRLDRAGFADLLVCQLVAEADELMARGLHRAYVPRSEWLSAPRGRIDIGRLAGQGAVTTRLPCKHHPRTEATPLNRALRGGLVLAGVVAADLGLRRAANQLAAVLGELVPSAPLTWEGISRAFAALTRLTAAYEPALTLTRLLYEAQGLVLGDGGNALRLPGFLFDMNRFFQALLSRFLRDHLPGYEVRDEQHLRGVMHYIPGYNPRRRRPPVPRPDFVVFRRGSPVAVLDAKYRDLWEHHLPREMLYQLAVYAATHQAGAATILYPTTNTEATEARLAVRDPAFGKQVAQVNLRPVILPALEQLVTAEGGAVAQRDRRQYAEQLLGKSGNGRA